MVDKKNTNHPVLRLVAARDDLTDVPRKYDQSTSGRVSSTGTAPPLSRSNAIAVDSAIRSFVDNAFRRYPSEVPQRPAYASCASRSSELRYDRKDSIDRTLPYSNILTIPFVHSPARPASYHGEMDTEEELKQLRKRRLAKLVDEYGTQDALAEKLGNEQNYISKLLRPNTSFGGRTARRIEEATGKSLYWLEIEDSQPPKSASISDWPFSFDRSYWDRLEPSLQREIEAAIEKMVLGASVQEMAAKRPKRKPA